MHALGFRRCLLVLLAVTSCGALNSTAFAQSQTGGSDLSQTPNTFGCETKPTFTEQSVNGDYSFVGSGQADCTWFQTGVVGNPSDPRTGAVPGDGRITRISVRSGPNPAQIRFTVARLFADSASGSRQCCFFAGESPLVQPAPNTISTFPVDLRVERNTNPFKVS